MSEVQPRISNWTDEVLYAFSSQVTEGISYPILPESLVSDISLANLEALEKTYRLRLVQTPGGEVVVIPNNAKPVWNEGEA